MLSFRKILATESDLGAKPAHTLARSLLAAIARECVPVEQALHADFERSIQELDDRMAASADPREIYAIAGSAEQAMQDYKQHVARYHNSQVTELEMIIFALCEALIELGGETTQLSLQLKHLEHQVREARGPAAMRDCRVQIIPCVSALREDFRKQRIHWEQTLNRLQGDLDAATGEGRKAKQGDDPVSGLPGRPVAEQALAELMASKPMDAYIVVCVVDRVNLVNAKFGYAVGDRLLQAFLRHVMTAFSRVDQLFRWTGPVFVLVLQRSDPLARVKAEVLRATAARLEENVESNGRNVLLPVTAASTVIALAGEPDYEHIVQKIDALAKQAGG